MKYIVPALLIAFTCVFSPVKAQAEASIAVVNVDRVMTSAKAAKSLEKQLDKKREAYQKEFSKIEQDLRKSRDKLLEDRSSMSDEELDKQARDFDKKLFESQKLFQQRRGDLNKAFKKANAQLQKAMFEATADIAEEQEYSIVLDRKSVVIVEESIDITDAVIKGVDKALPDVTLDIK